MQEYTGRWQRATDGARRNAQRGRTLASVFFARPVGRALRRYIDNNGNVLAGGIAYYSLASVAAALVLAVTIASIVVGGNETFRDAVFDFIGNAIPGIFPEDGNAGVVDPDTLQATPMSGFVGLIALAVLIYTATRYMRGMRAGTRTMLGGATSKSLPGSLRDVIALMALGLIAVAAATVQIVAGAFADRAARWIFDGDFSEVSVRVVAAVAGLAANVAFVAIVFLVLGSARAPARILITTIAATAVVIAILQQASSYFVASASSNSVLAPFAAVIALLLFVDFTARVLLIAAAWIGAATGGPALSKSAPLPSPGRRKGNTVTTRRATGRNRSNEPTD